VSRKDVGEGGSIHDSESIARCASEMEETPVSTEEGWGRGVTRPPRGTCIRKRLNRGVSCSNQIQGRGEENWRGKVKIGKGGKPIYASCGEGQKKSKPEGIEAGKNGGIREKHKELVIQG